MTFLKKIFPFLIMMAVVITVSILFCSCTLSDKISDENENQGDRQAEIDILQSEYEKLQSDYYDLLQDYRQQKKDYNTLLEEKAGISDKITEQQKIIDEKDIEISELENRLEGIEGTTDSDELKLKIEELRRLLDNINSVLANVYTGSSDPEEINYTFTAFSIKYGKSYYILTAGHCVADNYGSDGRFKFKPNFSDEWVYPDLIGYNADFQNLDDYAVFTGEDIYSGFDIGEAPTGENYLPGSIDKELSIFRNLGDSSRRGESGSPVINEYGKVIGIYVVYGLEYTPIELALELIDDYEKNNN